MKEKRLAAQRTREGPHSDIRSRAREVLAKGKEGPIPPQPGTRLEPLLESAHVFMFPEGSITGARVLCYQEEDTTAQAPEFLPSTVKVSRPSLLPPQPFQSTVHPADLGETPELVEVFEKRNPIIIWRQN